MLVDSPLTASIELPFNRPFVLATTVQEPRKQMYKQTLWVVR